MRRELARQVSEEGVEILPDLQMERLLAPDTRKNNGDLVEFVRAIILESSPDGVVAALGAMRDRPDSTASLGKISVPTAGHLGTEDALSTPEVMGELAEKIPDAPTHTRGRSTSQTSNVRPSSIHPREFLEEV